MEIDLAICTFRRPHLEQTLRSVAGLALPPSWKLRVIVADNDDTPSAQALAERTARETGLELAYLHAPARNISIARNACLDAARAPLLAFIDDDERVTPSWLEAMVAESERSGAEAVLGPVHSVFRPGYPAWMVKGDFHATLPAPTGGKLLTGYSCNVLLRRGAAALQGLRFRPELGRSGGEDTAFFLALTQAGGRIAYAQDAVVTEDVPPERASLSWLWKRRFRSGQTWGRLLSESAAPRLALIAQAACKALFCFACAAFSLTDPVGWRRWLLRGAVHAGVVSRLLGKGEAEQYGH